MSSDEKHLDQVIKQINKDYGEKIFGGQDANNYFSSGSLIIDNLINGNGYPIGRIIEIFGQPGTGKTTLALHAAAEMQKKNKKKIIFFDIERTLNLNYAKKIGINTENLVILWPKNAEETFNLLIELLETGDVSLIIVDSVAALLPESEAKRKMEENTIGLQARIMSKAMRKINYLLSETSSSLIFINQIREKIKIMFGNPETTSGGNALRFYSSLRLELRRKTKIMKKDVEIGISVKARVVKNKLGTPFAFNLISIYYGKGLSKISEIIEIAVENKIFQKRGNWFWYNKMKLGLGLENTQTFLKQNKKLLSIVEEKINMFFFEKNKTLAKLNK